MDYVKMENPKESNLYRGEYHIKALIDRLGKSVKVYAFKNISLQTELFKYKFYLQLSNLDSVALRQLVEYFNSWGLVYSFEAIPFKSRIELTVWVR